MRKRILSLLTALCLMLTLAPAAFAVDSDDLQTRISNASAGDVIALDGNETISTALVIDKEITLDGNGNTLTMTGGDFAIKVQTNDEVIVKELTINATATGGRGVRLSTTKPNFTLLDCTLTVNNRGIGFSDDGTIAGASVLVQDSTIQNSQKPDDKTYDNWTCHTDTRGIALWNNKGTQVTIDNSTIQGFAYTINLAGDMDSEGIRDFAGTEIDVTNSTLMGWTAFNVWSANTVFNITNSYLKGINNSNGLSDGFATIVVNDDIYGNGWGYANANVFTIKGGTITTYRSGAAPEDLFRVDRDGVTRVNFNYDDENGELVKFVDGTGTFCTVFYSGWDLDANHWQKFMATRVYGKESCTLTSYTGTTLTWTPYGNF